MTRDLPEWQPFPLDTAETAPLELAGTRGSTVVLLAAPEADASGWSVRAAARIARHRARRSGRVLLADLDLLHPRLQMEMGADNGEGMADFLLHGVSIGRVARPVASGFLFVPAGTAVGDPGQALTSPRLSELTRGFADAGADLFLYLPWTTPGRDHVLSVGRNLVLLAEEAEAGALALPELGGLRVGALLGPTVDPWAPAAVDQASGYGDAPSPAGAHATVVPPPSSPEAAPPDTGTPPSDVGAPPSETAESPDLLAGIPAAERPPLAPERDPTEFDALFHGSAAVAPVDGAGAPVRAPEEVAGAGTAEPPRDDPPTGSDPARLLEAANRRSRRIFLFFVLLAVVVAAALVAALAGVVSVPGVPTLAAFDRDDAAVVAEPTAGAGAGAGEDVDAPPAEARTPPDGASGSAPATPAGAPALPRAMAVGSYRDLDVALERADAMAARASDRMVVFVAPVAVDGLTWYRILAGPLPDVRPEGLTGAVSRVLGIDPDGWFVRETPLAFLLGEAETLADARARASALEVDGVPVHVLEVPGRPGRAPRYHLYGGGFAGEAEAARMRDILRERGLEDAPLVTRVGRVPADSPSPSA